MAEFPKNTSPEEETPFASVKLAKTPEEILAAQKLRYKIFYEEYGAIPTPEMQAERRDFDSYDNIADHLIVISRDQRNASPTKIVGTYRLLRQDIALQNQGFYSSQEFDISPLLNTGARLLELGRSCVLPAFRTKPILNLLWQGIADYVSNHQIEYLFGCASLSGTDIAPLREQLSYLCHFHKTKESIRPVALPTRYISMDYIPKSQLDERYCFNMLPPLIKGYLRVGATIGDGAVIDHQFNTTDVCVIMDTKNITDRYRKYYERKIQKNITGTESFFDVDGME